MAVSPQRCSEPERDRGPLVRCARAAAALIAILAVHSLVSHSGHAAGLPVAPPWILIVVALGAGFMLREAGRGLVSQLPRPQWSAKFAGAWVASSGLLMSVSLPSGGLLGSGASISILVAVGLGLVLAASLPGARRLLWSLSRLRHRIPIRIRGTAVLIPCGLTLTAAAPVPLLAGWSDRGPPLPPS